MVCFPINIEYLTTFYVGMAIARFPMLSICIYIRLLCVLTGWYCIYWSCNILRRKSGNILCCVYHCAPSLFGSSLQANAHVWKLIFPFESTMLYNVAFCQMDEEQIKANFSESKEGNPNLYHFIGAVRSDW